MTDENQNTAGPTPKKIIMARLALERKEAGLKKRSHWLSDEENKKVKEFIKNMRKNA